MHTSPRRVLTCAIPMMLMAVTASAQVTLSPNGNNMYNNLTVGVFNSLHPNTTAGLTSTAQGNLLNGISNNFTNLLGLGIANQLLLVPTVSPASGVLLWQDPDTGQPMGTKRGLGPVFAERAETTGRGKLYFGFAFQQINFGSLGVRQMSFGSLGQAFGANDTNETKFSSLKSLPLDNFPFVFQQQLSVGGVAPHGAPSTPCPCAGQASDWNHLPLYAIPQNSLTVHTSQTTAFFTYGLTDFLDASVILPFVYTNVDYSAKNPTLLNVGTAAQNLSPFTQSASSGGIGDVTLRLKGSLLRRKTGLALGADVRFPTGDERNFHGTGAGGVKPFLVISRQVGPITPHGNFGYQLNGNSILAGDVNLAGNGVTRKGHLPNSFLYTGGVDIDARKSFTISADLIGQRLYSAQILHLFPDMPLGPANTTASTGVNTGLPTFGYLTPYGMVNYGGKYVEDLNILTGAVGFKTLLGKNLMLTGNVLIKLNNSGLRSRLIPLIGLSYVH